MDWHFPLILPSRKDRNERMSNKVRAELKEFDSEIELLAKAKEALDVLHSAETLVRKFFRKHPSLSFKKVKNQVVHKNAQRGYYKRRKL